MDRNRRIEIMGIVNLTDNSYFASSRCLGPDGLPDMKTVLDRVETMLGEGADIIDIGACSTRPGSEPVGEREEWRRIGPVLSAVREAFPEARISIDTYWSSVVSMAYDTIGPFIVNDISAGEDDPMMLPLVGKYALEYIAMHKRGTPKTMQSLTDYPGGVVPAVLSYFGDFARRAEENGVRDWILDPGFGFAKTLDQNYTLLDGLPEFLRLGHRILVGVSRKSMVYRLFDITPEDSLPATQVLHLAALQGGADILRVHDVAEAARTVELYRRIG